MRSWMIALVAGIIAASLLPVLLSRWIILPFLLITAFLLHYHRTMGILFCGLFTGLAIGTLYGHSVLESRLSSQCEAIAVTLEGVIVSLPRRSPTRDGGLRQRFEFRPDSFEPAYCEGPGRLLLSYYDDLVLRPGERWRFSAKLKKPWGLANPGSFNMQSWYAQSGIDGTGNVRDKQAVLLPALPGHWFAYNELRQRISARLEQQELDKAVIGTLQAITVADKSGVNNRLWSLLQFYGINHLLVISGLHISITAAAGYLFGALIARLMAPLGLVRFTGMVPALMSIGFAFVYASLAGFALATVRALIMLGCFVVASLVSRGSLSANNLLIAAVIVLIFNPLSAIGSGFWLSFSAVACLLWLGVWRTEARLPLRLLHTHIYMALAMIPLGGWWFGGVSQVAMLANLLLVPLVGIVVVPIALLAVLTYLAGIPGDHYLWSAAAWPLEQLLPHALRLAENHSEVLYVHLSPSAVEVLLGIVALALLVTPMPLGLRCLIPVLALPIFLPGGEFSSDFPGHTRLTILDVGQGSAYVLDSGENTLVYDTGGGDPRGSNMASMVILPYLRSRGVERLDTLMISHADNDHSAGAGTLIESIPVRQVITGGFDSVYPGGRRCRAGEAWRWPSGISFQMLSPEPNEGLSSNNSSCVLQVHIGGLRLLLVGDIDSHREKDLLRYWRDGLRSEVLLVAHHGSLTSSSYTWLKIVQPEYAIFSSGYLNQFGHPHAAVRERYKAWGSRLFTTANHGAVEILFNPDGSINASSFRAYRHPYWM